MREMQLGVRHTKTRNILEPPLDKEGLAMHQADCNVSMLQLWDKIIILEILN